MKRYFFWILILVLVGTVLAQADTVYLKNGKAVSGDIVSQTKYSVKVKQGNFAETLYWDQIDRIEEEVQAPERETFDGPVSEEKKELILRLLTANKALEGIKMTLRDGVANLPLERRKAFDELLDADELVMRFVEVYAKYFSEEDLREMVRYYTSPVGQKNIETMPEVVKESLEAAVQYFKEIEAEPQP